MELIRNLIKCFSYIDPLASHSEEIEIGNIEMFQPDEADEEPDKIF
jgi:hypothetical protein